jgi:hypothetical protein
VERMAQVRRGWIKRKEGELGERRKENEGGEVSSGEGSGQERGRVGEECLGGKTKDREGESRGYVRGGLPEVRMTLQHEPRILTWRCTSHFVRIPSPHKTRRMSVEHQTSQ